MSKVDNPIKIIRTLMDCLEVVGIKTVLAGGAARDVLHGIVPKDYDLWVIGEEDVNSSEEKCSLVTSALSKASFLLGNLRESVRMVQSVEAVFLEGYEGADAGMDTRVDGVIKATFYDLDVDIIWATHEDGSTMLDVQEVMSTFDLSLNQVFVDFSRDGYEAVAGEDYQECVRIVRYDVSAYRILRLYQKFPQYDWSQPMQWVRDTLKDSFSLPANSVDENCPPHSNQLSLF